jgi:alkylation response protein AidB-like acyl-CoA dehydrogenase
VTTITNDEREAICETFERLMASGSTEADVRKAMESELGHDPALWRQCAELGFAGLLVPAEFGGIGAGARELELIMERAGAALACLPLLSSGVLAVSVVAGSSDDAAKGRLLPGLVDGSIIGTVALTGAKGLWSEEDIDVIARREGEGWRLAGSAAFVTDAVTASLILVLAVTEDDEIGFFEVESVGSVGIDPLRTFDRTQRLARLRFENIAARRLHGADGALLTDVLVLARIALAGRQAGAARRIFDITLDYLKTRVQFGRPIGGFQAIKHMAADLLLEVESATSAARAAAEAVDAGADDAAELVSLASFACGDSFVKVAADAIQMHGGIGFTWEHSAHLFMRRARGDLMLFGSPDTGRERYLRILERVA